MIKYFILFFVGLSIGCKSVELDTIDEVIPALEKQNNLLFSEPNIARKSVTKDDYELEQYN